MPKRPGNAGRIAVPFRSSTRTVPFAEPFQVRAATRVPFLGATKSKYRESPVNVPLTRSPTLITSTGGDSVGRVGTTSLQATIEATTHRTIGATLWRDTCFEWYHPLSRCEV